MQRKPFYFKGDTFKNRYRITGTLWTKSPMHIGTGETRADKAFEESDAYKNLSDEEKKKTKVPEIGEIARDYRDYPYIPGSTLRGVLRHFLLQLFQPINAHIARIENYETHARGEYAKQADQIIYIRDHACMLDQLFGTPFHESKVEFWDAYLENPIPENANTAKLKEKGWDNEGQSYVVRSVAIDPETGAAAPNKLYSFDVAPPGQKYKLDIVGYNLDHEELGMLITGLCGFNSEILPLQIGAMAGRGFGHLKFTLENIFYIENGNIKNYLSLALNNNLAGFDYLPHCARKRKMAGLCQKF